MPTKSATRRKLDSKGAKKEADLLKEELSVAQKERDYYRDAVHHALSDRKARGDIIDALTDEERRYFESRWDRFAKELFRQNLARLMAFLALLSGGTILWVKTSFESLVRHTVEEMVTDVARAKKDSLIALDEARSNANNLRNLVQEVQPMYDQAKEALEQDVAEAGQKASEAERVSTKAGALVDETLRNVTNLGNTISAVSKTTNETSEVVKKLKTDVMEAAGLADQAKGDSVAAAGLARRAKDDSEAAKLSAEKVKIEAQVSAEGFEKLMQSFKVLEAVAKSVENSATILQESAALCKKTSDEAAAAYAQAELEAEKTRQLIENAPPVMKSDSQQKPPEAEKQPAR